MAEYKEKFLEKQASRRHPFSLAFSTKRMAQPDCHVRRTPVEPESDVYVRLTAQGQRRVEAMRKMTPVERMRTMRVIMDRARQAKRDLDNERKRIILDILRKEGEQDSDGRFILLEQICDVLDVPVIEAVLLLHEINGNNLEPDDEKPYVYAFFNHGSGQVYVELWEPEPGERAG